MRTAKCLVIVLVTVGVLFGDEQPVSNTRTASCIVRITVDPATIPLNPQVIRPLILGSSVAGKAIRKVWNLHYAEFPSILEGIEVEWLAQEFRTTDSFPSPPQAPSASSRTNAPGDAAFPSTTEAGQSTGGQQNTREDSGTGNMTGGSGGAMAGGGMMGGGDMSGYGGWMMGGGTGGYGGGMMGGMGAGMGGMMGGGMMSGGMGGMMGGPGMGGGIYGGPRPGTSASTIQQSATLRLSVQLPDNVKPAAEEFLKAVVRSLTETLGNAYGMYERNVADLLKFKEHQRDLAENAVEEAMGAKPDMTDRGKQLNAALQTIVDLSMLSPEMPFEEAIEILKNATEPPLPIVVMWKELLEDCDIEPTTPIDMDGLPSVKLDTALRTLLAAVSGAGADVSYQIDDDVIVIREEELQNQQPTVPGPSMEVDVRELMAQRRDLARRRQALEMDFATSEARRRAIEVQINVVRMETAQKIEADSVAREMQNLVEMSQKHVDLLARRADAGTLSTAELDRARESLTRAKIELARRREELANSAGGGQLKEFNSELSRMTIDMAEKRAELDFIRQQLAQTEDQLAQASRFDPRATRIRMTREALDAAEAQVTALRNKLAKLQFPTLTVIGAD